ncbi:MAG: DoxX family protein, partial [Gemmataceae bacterium]|nr:DoxX family protein [Gemmataceae bacterium]
GGQWFPELDPNVQLAVTWGETVGGAALLFGFLTRPAALGVAIIQVGAIILVTGKRDFIDINTLPAHLQPMALTFHVGYEYNVALIAMCLALCFSGAGRLSLDFLLFERRRQSVSSAVAPSGNQPLGHQ